MELDVIKETILFAQFYLLEQGIEGDARNRFLSKYWARIHILDKAIARQKHLVKLTELERLCTDLINSCTQKLNAVQLELQSLKSLLGDNGLHDGVTPSCSPIPVSAVRTR